MSVYLKNYSDFDKKPSNVHEEIFCLGLLEVWHIIREMTVIAKRELLLLGTWGIASWLAGLTFINRQGGERGKETINKTMAVLKSKNIKLWVFAEGEYNIC